MAKKITFNTKRLMVNRANTQIVAMVSGAAVVVIFSLVASRALLSQRAYQSKIIHEKEAAVKQLKTNDANTKMLVVSYNEFVDRQVNILGGNSLGDQERDGDNARIVLDALPSLYDFPALITSVEKMISSGDYFIESISGDDDEINQAAKTSEPEPQPVEMPFEVTVTGTYGAAQKLVSTMEKSIRPFHINALSLDGNDSKMEIKITAKSYYQPEKSLELRSKQIR